MASSSTYPTTNKASSSILELRALVAQQKASGKREERKEPRSQSKSGVWARANKGVTDRAAKDDAAWAKVHARTAESMESKLRKKAEIYEKLQRGKTGGLNEAQLSNLLVDFDAKDAEEESSEEDSADEISTKPEQSDPLVEITDEFGRTRQVRRSEVPRDYLVRRDEPQITDDDPNVLRGRNISHFPVYQPSAERVAKIMEDAIEDPLTKHYDVTNENRAKGAAFYQFSSDEETRQKQMEELLRMRAETTEVRAERGTVDQVRAQDPGEPETEETVLSKATAKRKRDLEERRAQVMAKRRKKEVSDEKESGALDAMDFLDKMSRELGKG